MRAGACRPCAALAMVPAMAASTPLHVLHPPAQPVAAAVAVGWRSDPVGIESGASRLEPLSAPAGSPACAAFCTSTFVLRAPYGFRCRIQVGERGAGLQWVENPTGLQPWEVFAVTPKSQWSAPDRPAVQWLLNSLLVADAPAWAETMAPLLSARARAWPGVVIPGVLDIQRWVRPFQWVFEWHDPDRELCIEAGEPIQYVCLHAPDADARFLPEPLPDSPELRHAIVRCAKLAPFQRNALACIEEAHARRPAQLLGAQRS